MSYDRYLARETGRWLAWECEECNNHLNDEGDCEWCEEDESDG